MSEIDLPAGVELDALLAEKLFEWRDVRARIEWWKDAVSGTPPGHPDNLLLPVPYYSAQEERVGDILAAMLAKGYVPTIRRLDDGRINAFMATRENRHGEATSYTLAHAVCLAAARALSIAPPATGARGGE